MADIILQLPDNIANQIAAGEVIQRPASVVKELLENAVDAGASSVQLIVKDAGKQLIQVIDNGCGMTVNDARMCFERHATSKIKKAEDLFAIQTFGFRGEAMSSVAAVCQVEMLTRRTEDAVGTRIEIEGSEFKIAEPVATAPGTNISVKNLFFNIPARRAFLKSNGVEMRHITEEFMRVSLANPQTGFTLSHNGNTLYQLKSGNIRQRIVQIFGEPINSQLVPVEELTSFISVQGFILKPQAARKYRGEQYFFVNGRFVKNPYLEHAIASAFEGLIAAGHHPGFFLSIQIDPSRIDVNVHPTKTEIKFDDDRSAYAIVHSAAKHALSQYNIAPSIDFDVDPTITQIPYVNKNNLHLDNETRKSFRDPYVHSHAESKPSSDEKSAWANLYKELAHAPIENFIQSESNVANATLSNVSDDKVRSVWQLHNQFIFAQVKNGVMMINQRAALYRISYDQLVKEVETNKVFCQQLLFPETVSLTPSDAELISSELENLGKLGFDIRELGGNTFICQGIPAVLTEIDIQSLLQDIVGQLRSESGSIYSKSMESIANGIAYKQASKQMKNLSQVEIISLIDQLFACENPYIAPNGSPISVILNFNQLEQLF